MLDIKMQRTEERALLCGLSCTFSFVIKEDSGGFLHDVGEEKSSACFPV